MQAAQQCFFVAGFGSFLFRCSLLIVLTLVPAHTLSSLHRRFLAVLHAVLTTHSTPRTRYYGTSLCRRRIIFVSAKLPSRSVLEYLRLLFRLNSVLSWTRCTMTRLVIVLRCNDDDWWDSLPRIVFKAKAEGVFIRLTMVSCGPYDNQGASV